MCYRLIRIIFVVCLLIPQLSYGAETCYAYFVQSQQLSQRAYDLIQKAEASAKKARPQSPLDYKWPASMIRERHLQQMRRALAESARADAQARLYFRRAMECVLARP